MSETIQEESTELAQTSDAGAPPVAEEADGRWDYRKAEIIGQATEGYADSYQKNYDRQMERFGRPGGMETAAEYRDRVTELLDKIYDTDPDLFSKMEPEVFLGVAGRLSEIDMRIENASKALESWTNEKAKALKNAREIVDGQGTQEP